MELSQSHRFQREEARERVRALGDYLSNRHGMQVTWTGDDHVAVRGKYKVVKIEAEVHIDSDAVRVTGKDPGMLFRLPAKTYIGGKLAKYLDAGENPDALPRR